MQPSPRLTPLWRYAGSSDPQSRGAMVLCYRNVRFYDRPCEEIRNKVEDEERGGPGRVETLRGFSFEVAFVELMAG